MKTSTKLLIVAACMTLVGVTLIVVGAAVLADKDFAGVGMPHLGTFIPGIFITFMSIPLWFLGFMPRIAKASANLHNEALDGAGKEMGAAMKKTADMAAPAIRTVASAAAQGVKSGLEQTVFCKKCGKSIADDSEFCKFCGEKQN